VPERGQKVVGNATMDLPENPADSTIDILPKMGHFLKYPKIKTKNSKFSQKKKKWSLDHEQKYAYHKYGC
jgi:hypothetical protein